MTHAPGEERVQSYLRYMDGHCGSVAANPCDVCFLAARLSKVEGERDAARKSEDFWTRNSVALRSDLEHAEQRVAELKRQVRVTGWVLVHSAGGHVFVPRRVVIALERGNELQTWDEPDGSGTHYRAFTPPPPAPEGE